MMVHMKVFMNEETSDFLKRLILENASKLPNDDKDWMGEELYHAAPYILSELCIALDIYEEEKEE